MTFHRMLIANRGEIAKRVIRTSHALGIETVLVVSEPDRDSPPARLADHVVLIGPGPAAASYLDVTAVIRAAMLADVDALHPGYGFLAESARLARACQAADIVFVGPSPEVLEAAGDKLTARQHALAAGLPVVPGGAAGSYQQARQVGERIGYPLLVKAAGGGGGRGIQRVDAEAQLAGALTLAMAEADAGFGDSRVYLERYVTGRHVEVQILGDGEQVVHLGERDCSVQRRYQKLLEEAPAPRLDPDVRDSLHASATALARHLRYRGLGTVEFLVDSTSGEFYFLEMNARIQVEHPVTEMVTGLDLVAEQIAVAEGRPLWLTQSEVAVSGHALECRINAEDWLADFQPDPGTVESAAFPVGERVRVDTHIQDGTVIPPYYDSLLAKVIVHGADRTDALELMRAALMRCRIAGIATTLDLHRALLADTDLANGGVDTSFFSRFLARAQEASVRVAA